VIRILYLDQFLTHVIQALLIASDIFKRYYTANWSKPLSHYYTHSNEVLITVLQKKSTIHDSLNKKSNELRGLQNKLKNVMDHVNEEAKQLAQ
jgi:hypothetical protein